MYQCTTNSSVVSISSIQQGRVPVYHLPPLLSQLSHSEWVRGALRLSSPLKRAKKIMEFSSRNEQSQIFLLVQLKNKVLGPLPWAAESSLEGRTKWGQFQVVQVELKSLSIFQTEDWIIHYQSISPWDNLCPLLSLHPGFETLKITWIKYFWFGTKVLEIFVISTHSLVLVLEPML